MFYRPDIGLLLQQENVYTDSSIYDFGGGQVVRQCDFYYNGPRSNPADMNITSLIYFMQRRK